jgi:GGDEF domain-containing protein
VLTAIAHRVPIFAVPAAILIAACFTLPRVATLTPAHQELTIAAPYALSIAGICLSLHFHRGRPLYLLIMLVLFYWTVQNYLSGGIIGLTGQAIVQGFSVILPINLVIVTMMRERGIFTTAGRLRMAFLTGEGLIAAWLFGNHFVDLQPFVGRHLVTSALLNKLHLPQPVLLLSVGCFLLLAVVALLRQTPVDSAFAGALAAVFIACNGVTTPFVTAIFCSAAALIVTLSILQDSYNMAFRDDLTGLPARRALNESLHGIGRRYAVAMVDIDHFKKFNDTYGHDVGDQVLKLVAKKLMGVGGGGTAYRYGGEEFTVLFPRQRAADILPHLEELRATIADYPLFIRSSDRPADKRQGKQQRGCGREGTYTSVTVSIGVAESGEERTAPETVLKSADKALYKAKNRGRNQVVKS